MHIDRNRALEAFRVHASAYDAANPRIALKVDHTLRVASLCERIADSLTLPADDVDLAWLCGLLHDIGRFEQVRRWGTFNDAASEPHAPLGVEVLFGDEGCIRRFVEDTSGDACIRTVIATHSDFRLPETLDTRTRMFCDILRDADKVDILKASCTCDKEAIFNVGEAALRESRISPAVAEAFYAHRCVLRSERRHPADLVLGFVCFAFELVHEESVRAAAEQGHLFELLDIPFELSETRAQVAVMRTHLENWLATQLG